MGLTYGAFGYILIAKDLQVEIGTIMAQASLIQRLRGAGLRATAARRAVIDVLEQRRQHLSAEDIHETLRARGVRIDLSSVYRTLTLLLRLGFVRPVAPSERHGHFEIEHDERVHFVCARCGAVIEVDLASAVQLEPALTRLAVGNDFDLANFTIEATGECATCRRQRGRGGRGPAAAGPPRSHAARANQ
jgi:Fur family ferric uptake transcriptional regulator